MNLPNKISLFRILLVPCIVASLLYYHPSRDGLRYVTLALFVIGVLSDALDGFIARTTHQQSPLGAVLDPIADKLLILGTLISLSAIHGLPAMMRIPAWFNLIVLSRDAVLLVGTILIILFTGSSFPVKPNMLGKCTSVSQMLAIPTALLGITSAAKTGLLIAAALLTIASGISYVRIGARLAANDA